MKNQQYSAETLVAFEKLLEVMEELREKCPWDQKQTLDSLRHLTIEETYEISEAIINQDFNSLKGELGDVLLHIIFYSKIASETQLFNITDVIQTLTEKLIRRHPHIYGDAVAEDAEKVKSNWEEIKLKEGAKSVLGGVPAGLPSLIKAYRIQEKAASVGFDWDNAQQVWDKVEEEMNEMKEAEHETQERFEEEMGDLFFALINYARKKGINPEDALEKTNKKFIQRFNYVEAKAKENEKKLKEMTLEEMDVFWNEAKKMK